MTVDSKRFGNSILISIVATIYLYGYFQFLTATIPNPLFFFTYLVVGVSAASISLGYVPGGLLTKAFGTAVIGTVLVYVVQLLPQIAVQVGYPILDVTEYAFIFSGYLIATFLVAKYR